MIPVSTVPAAQAYLLTAIQAQASTDPLYSSMLVRLGPPGPNIPNDLIVIGWFPQETTTVRRNLKPATFIGGGGRDWENETYDITVTVGTWLPTSDADADSTLALAANARMWQLIGYVETAVRLDPSLGELVTLAYPSSTTTSGPGWAPDGYEAMAEVTVRVECLN